MSVRFKVRVRYRAQRSSLTSDDKLSLPADGGGCVAGDAGVVPVVLQGHLGDLEGAHELFGFDGDAGRGAGDDELPVFVPGDADGHVPRGHHAGDVHELPHGGGGDVEGLDQRRNWAEEEGRLEG